MSRFACRFFRINLCFQETMKYLSHCENLHFEPNNVIVRLSIMHRPYCCGIVLQR
jgi:hypothetical protein